MSSYKKAPINTVHPFLRMNARNNRCFSHTSVCFHYRPNNCSMLWEGKRFQDTCKCSCRFDQNKETVIIPKVHLHWQMLTGLFYIEFSSILSLCRSFKLLNSPILTTLNMPKTGAGHVCLTPWPAQPAAKPHLRNPFCTPPAAQGRKVSPASRGEGGQATRAQTDQSSPVRFRRGVPTDTSARLPATCSQDSRPAPPLPTRYPQGLALAVQDLAPTETCICRTPALLNAEAERYHLPPLWRGKGKGFSLPFRTL